MPMVLLAQFTINLLEGICYLSYHGNTLNTHLIVLSTEEGILCGRECFEIGSCFSDLTQYYCWGKSFLAQKVNYDTSECFISSQIDPCDQPCDGETLVVIPCVVNSDFYPLPLLGLPKTDTDPKLGNVLSVTIHEMPYIESIEFIGYIACYQTWTCCVIAQQCKYWRADRKFSLWDIFCSCISTSITVISWKSAHGWSILQVCQRGEWALFQVCRVFSVFSMKIISSDARYCASQTLQVHSETLAPRWAFVWVNFDPIQ